MQALIRAYGSDGTCGLRQIGETNLAWIAGERARQAADLLDDPVWKAAAAFGRAHARSSANKPKGLMITPQLADETEPHIGDDLFAHQAYGMLRLSAALACAVQNDHRGAAEHAAEAAALADRDGERPGAWELFGPANVGVWRTSLAVEAGEAEAALTYADQVEPQDLASQNRRAALRLEKARAYAMLGKDSDAIREMRQAERIAPAQTRNNPLIRELVRDMLSRARREAGRPGPARPGLANEPDLRRFPGGNIRAPPVITVPGHDTPRRPGHQLRCPLRHQRGAPGPDLRLLARRQR